MKENDEVRGVTGSEWHDQLARGLILPLLANNLGLVHSFVEWDSLQFFTSKDVKHPANLRGAEGALILRCGGCQGKIHLDSVSLGTCHDIYRHQSTSLGESYADNRIVPLQYHYLGIVPDASLPALLISMNDERLLLLLAKGIRK